MKHLYRLAGVHKAATLSFFIQRSFESFMCAIKQKAKKKKNRRIWLDEMIDE